MTTRQSSPRADSSSSAASARQSRHSSPVDRPLPSSAVETVASPSTEISPVQTVGGLVGRKSWGKSVAQGQWRVEKKKPKRRTKKNMNPQELQFVERQEELKKSYQALALALAPCLNELAGRTLASLQLPPAESLPGALRYEAVIKQDLAARTEEAKRVIRREEELVARVLATKLECDVRAARTDYSATVERCQENLLRGLTQETVEVAHAMGPLAGQESGGRAAGTARPPYSSHVARFAGTERDWDQSAWLSEPESDHHPSDEPGEGEYAFRLLTSFSRAMGYAKR